MATRPIVGGDRDTWGPKVIAALDELQTGVDTATAIGAGAASAAQQLQSDIAGLQPAGDYPTVAEMQTALGTKADLNHTQAISSVTGLQAALDGKADATHTQAISTITGLQTALDGKAASSHTHTVANVTGLQTALDAKVDTADITERAVHIYYAAGAWPARPTVASGQHVEYHSEPDIGAPTPTDMVNNDLWWPHPLSAIYSEV